MKALVTGGAGFIGSNLVDSLVAEGYDVTAVDNLTTGRRSNLRDDVEFWEMGVADERLPGLMKERGIEIVFHHAAQIDVRRSVSDPHYDASINILDGIRFLEACTTAGVTKFVYASTGGAIYGEPGGENLPCTEEFPPTPLAGYGVSKYTLEHYLRLFGDLHGMKYCVLRYANVYGPRQDPMGEAGVVAIFLERLIGGKTPIIYGDGKQTRDYVFVGDVCRANLKAAKKLDGETYNIGTGVETSVVELFDGLLEATSKTDLKANFEPARQGEVNRISLSPAKAKGGLGWEPQVALKEGLALTLASFEKTLR